MNEGPLLLRITGWSLVLLGAAFTAFPRALLGEGGQSGLLSPLVAWLDRRVFVERAFYRHHRVLGLLIMGGALYTGVRLSQAKLPVEGSELWLTVGVVAAVRFLILSSVAVLLLGAVIFARPSRLKGVEAWANRWVFFGVPASARRQTRTRLLGVALALVGFYILTLLTVR